MFDENRLDEVIKKAEGISIYGAGIVAYNISAAILDLFGKRINRFYVTSIGQQKHFFGGVIPEEWEKSKKNERDLIIVAMPNVYQDEVEQILINQGVTNYLLVNENVEYSLMGRYLKKNKNVKLIEDCVKLKEKCRENYVKAEVYMAQSIYDKQLKQRYEKPKYIIPVQAGAALTKKHFLEMKDNMGTNISERNRNYSELSVTYWAWKNRKATYKGICHYRRMFLLSQEDINEIAHERIDVILPLPFLCYPDTSEQYFRYIKKEDFENFLIVIEQYFPKVHKNISDILNGGYIYNYNMLIAKEEVFDDYCFFVFSILEKLEMYYEQRGIVRNDRYLGYFGELLTTVYFIMNEEKLKIVHANKIWMV